MPQLQALDRITVIDDDELGREELIDQLRDCNYEPVAVAGAYGHDVDRLVRDVQLQSPSFVICDHRLQPKGLAAFHGLDVVRKLLAAQQPAMLLTVYQSTDRLELRASRHLVPVILGRDAFSPDAMEHYSEICRREIASDPVDERRPHRSLIRVDFIDQVSGNIDALVPAWSPDRAVTIPAACLDQSLRGQVKIGDHLLGDVNIGASAEDELFFTNINEIIQPVNIPGVP